jgi:uncharacterized integral membrane protein
MLGQVVALKLMVAEDGAVLVVILVAEVVQGALVLMLVVVRGVRLLRTQIQNMQEALLGLYLMLFPIRCLFC